MWEETACLFDLAANIYCLPTLQVVSNMQNLYLQVLEYPLHILTVVNYEWIGKNAFIYLWIDILVYNFI